MPDILVVKFKPNNAESASLLPAVMDIVKAAIEQLVQPGGKKIMFNIVKVTDGYSINLELDWATKLFGLKDGEQFEGDAYNAWKDLQNLKADLSGFCDLEYSVVSVDGIGVQ